MHLINQYAPERYLVNMRATIQQQWQNGLPVVEDFLAQQDYSQSLSVIQEILSALLKSNQVDNSWMPETSLLFTIISRTHYSNQNGENEKTLLHYYQQTARGLGESERKPNSKFLDYREQVLNLLSGFDDYSLYWIPRKQNKLADRAADKCLKENQPTYSKSFAEEYVEYLIYGNLDYYL